MSLFKVSSKKSLYKRRSPLYRELPFLFLPFEQAVVAMGLQKDFAARDAKISLMSTNQEKRIRGTKEMIENRNVNIITDVDGKKLVLINDIRFKAKVRDDWTAIEEYLKEYIGDFYEIEETSEKIYISADFPDEYASSESRIALKGAVAKAKANAAQAIPELIRIAANPKHEVNRKEKHKTDAMFGWYRYDIRFALPVYDDKMGKITRHNIYSASMLVRHADNAQKYLYDILAIKKETSSPLE